MVHQLIRIVKILESHNRWIHSLECIHLFL
nr:MAG TPA: hypothetical protein [Myoviridae sp. ctNPX13]